MLELLTDLMQRRRRALRLRRGPPRRRPQRGARRPQRPRRRDRQLRLGGHRRARAGRRRLGLRRHARRHARRARRRRWRARSPSPRRSPRRRTGPLAPVAPALGHWASPYELDPFAVALEDKLELLFAAEAALRTGDERLVRTAASCRAWRERKAFASTEGAACTQETVATRRGHRRLRHRRQRPAGALLPDRPRRRPERRRGLGARARPRPRRATPRAWPRRRSRC